MVRAGLTSTLVVSEAGNLADEVGFENLTISALAQRLGVKQPTLYKHVTGTSGLHREMAVLAKLELAEVMRRSAVGKSGDDALMAISTAYRTWATKHPGRYAATVRAPAPGDEKDEHASHEALDVVTSVLDGYGITGDDAIDVTRSFRAALHGFVTLEAAGGFGLPADVDRSFDRLIRNLVRAIADWRIPS
jgi:AcrR family transcriptional regulator